MRAFRLFALASMLVSFLSLAMLAPAAGATTASSQYAAYSISGNFGNHSITALVNETVAPSSSSGMSDLTLKIASSMSNFSYSKIVNSSGVMFPYFPTVANQSFSYQVHNYSISASIVQSGTGSVTFSGKTYSLTNYTFSVSGAKFGGSPMNATGGASVFPSGLVYSAWVRANASETIHVQLVGTNLPLDASSGSSQTTSIAVAGGAGSILAGVGAFVFYKRKNSTHKTNENGDKPLYHVD
ncbi:MAG TPA: LPXTG cell wall anchor domain-containing protein [Nitrososphaerales archaeon]|nr:LPXTG cell wall anchor domain-containing protein [Nitrososphaerales archaeon]